MLPSIPTSLKGQCIDYRVSGTVNPPIKGTENINKLSHEPNVPNKIPNNSVANIPVLDEKIHNRKSSAVSVQTAMNPDKGQPEASGNRVESAENICNAEVHSGKTTPDIPFVSVQIYKKSRKKNPQVDRQVLAESSRPENRISINNENMEYRVVTDDHQVQTKLVKNLHAAKLQQEKAEQASYSKGFINTDTFDDPKRVAIKDIAPGETSISITYNENELFFETTEETTILCETCPATYSGIAAAQGRRKKGMEDAHIARQFTVKVGNEEIPIDITGVFDGHGGTRWSSYASHHIEYHLKKRIAEFNRDGLSDVGIWNALKIALVDLDLEKLEGFPTDGSGTTANIALGIKGELWIANVGDSRAILLDQQGNTTQISQDAVLSQDNNIAQGVTDRGGVFMTGRVYRADLKDGGLNMARSLGDHWGEGIISARPKITRITAKELTGKTLIQVCDGLTDVAHSREIGQYIHQYLKNVDSPTRIAGMLVGRAFAAESKDNLTAIVTRLKSLNVN